MTITDPQQDIPNRHKAVFFDRDDTLIIDSGYINTPGQVILVHGAAEALAELKSMGYKLVVVSNQSAVARGLVTEKTLGQIHNRLRELLARRGAVVDEILYCPYHPDGTVPQYRKESEWRKPRPGMILDASTRLDIDLAESWVIGDRGRDIQAGRSAGCKTILVLPPSGGRQYDPSGPPADYVAVNLREAANIIKKNQRRRPDGPVESTQTEVYAEEQPSEDIYRRPDAEAVSFEPEPLEEQAVDSAAVPDDHVVVLNDILRELKRLNRDDLFDEFSVMRLMAGVLQVAVLFCVLIAVWFLTGSQRRPDAVQTALGFAVISQLMALTFYIMQSSR